MSRKPLTKLAQEFIEGSVFPGDTVIDATLGNGHDTLFLTRLIAPSGQLFGFDIQQKAVSQTQGKLQQEGLESLSQLFQRGHEQMSQSIPAEYHGKISAIMFNLGYLPGGDKGVTTLPVSTAKALDCSLQLLAPGGRLTIMAYIGHPGGQEEANEVEHWIDGLQADLWQCQTIQPENLHTHPPKLYCCEKLLP